LKPERWGSPLVQEKYREEKVCEKRQQTNNNNNNNNNKITRRQKGDNVLMPRTIQITNQD